MMSHLHK